ncbi:hypothetical protein VV11_011860 [Trichodesmium erythraeum 21-75]|nr:hypothetical protein [Trichodesmium erythraeum 21-75]
MQAAVKLLSKTGKLAVIYPVEKAQIFQEKAEYLRLFCQIKLDVKPMPKISMEQILI